MAIVDTSATVLSPDEHRRALRRAVLASTIGTTVEWYDLFLCGLVAGLVLAKLGFPHSDPLIGAVAAFSIYAAILIAGPVGAAVEAWESALPASLRPRGQIAPQDPRGRQEHRREWT